VLRTADAFGAAGLLLGEGCTDPFSCKAVRAAMGSTYHIPIWKGDLPYELGRLKAQGFGLVCGHLAGEEKLPPLPENRVLVIGNEANGVSPEAAEKCALYRLPMRGRAESLNAAVAAAILIYKLTE
jgi:TrmH family RNA methyltransferase